MVLIVYEYTYGLEVTLEIKLPLTNNCPVTLLYDAVIPVVAGAPGVIGVKVKLPNSPPPPIKNSIGAIAVSPH